MDNLKKRPDPIPVSSGGEKGKIEADGVVYEALPNTMFRVRLNDGREVLCQLAGKMRILYIKLMPGYKLKIQTTPYDDKRGRIVYRYK
jgi:translation initiation factor IF-1